MNNLSESFAPGGVQLRKPENTINTMVVPSINVSPSVVKIGEDINKAFEERASRFRRPVPSEENIKNQIAKIVGDRLKYYYENIEAHPSEMGFPKDWKVEQVKADYINGYYVYACIVLNTEENSRWFVFFDAKSNASKNIDPHYFNIKTKHFNIDKFPMEMVSKAPQEARGKAIEMTEKQFEDTVGSKRVGGILSKL